MKISKLVMPLWRYPMHKLDYVFGREDRNLWAWGFVVPAWGDSGLMIAWIKKERPRPRHRRG